MEVQEIDSIKLMREGDEQQKARQDMGRLADAWRRVWLEPWQGRLWINIWITIYEYDWRSSLSSIGAEAFCPFIGEARIRTSSSHPLCGSQTRSRMRARRVQGSKARVIGFAAQSCAKLNPGLLTA